MGTIQKFKINNIPVLFPNAFTDTHNIVQYPLPALDETPELIQTNWNGKDYLVQAKDWEYYIVSFWTTREPAKAIQKSLYGSCKMELNDGLVWEIEITEFNIEQQALEFVKVNLKFRVLTTNETGIVRDATVVENAFDFESHTEITEPDLWSLSISSGAQLLLVKTKLTPIPVTVPELRDELNNEKRQYSHTVKRQQIQARFFLNQQDRDGVLDYLSRLGSDFAGSPIAANINNGTIFYNLIESSITEWTDINAVDLYQVDVNTLTAISTAINY